MYYDTLNSEEQVSYLIKPILEVLQAAGGQLERSEIRDRISELDEHIAEFEQKLYTSNKTGNQYKKFDFKFNFAIKRVRICWPYFLREIQSTDYAHSRRSQC